jgi:hypothetical protein
MTVTTETETVHTILSLARQLSAARRRWLAELLSRESDTPLPEHATLDEAIALYWMRVVWDEQPNWLASHAGTCKIG